MPGRDMVFQDEIRGELRKGAEHMKDFVIVRSNGTPVFHLANVVDDIFMGITHVIRGDDHIENTYRHVALFAALDAPIPRYAHLPMIVNAQGKPYAKRDGDAYVGDFREKGYLPEALFNYLALLGWSPGDDREKLSRDELVRLFTLDRVRGAPSQMDLRKLLDMNRQYVAEQPPEQFAANVRRALAHCDWAQGVDESYFRRVCALMQSRTHVYRLAEGWRYFFVEDPGWDEEAGRKHLGAAGMAGALAGLRDRLAACDFSVPAIEAAIHEAEAAAGIAAGRMNQPIRVAVTGTTQGAGIFETIELLGRDRALARLDRAVRRLSEAAR
jgi:glutamyl-tRNA synthetase